MNPLLQGHSGTTPEHSRNALSTSQGTNEDDSQNDPHSEAGLFHSQMTQNSGPEDGHDMVTGVQRETRNGHDMLTGAQKESRYRHDLTGVYDEVTYCFPITSSGKQKEPFYQPTAIPQREHPCDDRSRSDFVGPSAVGK